MRSSGNLCAVNTRVENAGMIELGGSLKLWSLDPEPALGFLCFRWVFLYFGVFFGIVLTFWGVGGILRNQ